MCGTTLESIWTVSRATLSGATIFVMTVCRRSSRVGARRPAKAERRKPSVDRRTPNAERGVPKADVD